MMKKRMRYFKGEFWNVINEDRLEHINRLIEFIIIRKDGKWVPDQDDLSPFGRRFINDTLEVEVFLRDTNEPLFET